MTLFQILFMSDPEEANICASEVSSPRAV